MPATNFTALRLRRDILANSDIGAMLLNKEEGGPHFNRVAGVDANFRFGEFLTTERVRRRRRSRPPRPCRRRATSSRLAPTSVRLPDRTWQCGGDGHDASAPGSTTRWGSCRGAASTTTRLQANYRFRPLRSLEWIREIQPHWDVDMFTAQDGRQPRFALSGLPLPDQLPGRLVRRGRREPERRSDRDARSPSTARAASCVNPGRYEFDEYFILVNTNDVGAGGARRPLLDRRVLRWLSPQLRVGPSFRLNENFNTSLNVQINDIELSTGAYVSTLITGARELQLQHEDVRERAAAVQHRLAPVELEPALQHHPPAAQRLLPRLQRAARRADRATCWTAR